MFLDGQLRRIAARKQGIALRGELGRRFLRLELGQARAAVMRSLTDLRFGWTLAEQVLGFLRRR
jgi:hypothetical protein